MVLNDHREFLQLLKLVMSLSIDPSVLQRAGISRDIFFKEIYVPFAGDEEAAVHRAIISADSFTIITAPTGAGKSTIIQKAIYEYSKSGGGSFFYLDFKVIAEHLYRMGNESDDQLRFLQILFKQQIAQLLLNDIDIKAKFVFSAISRFYPEERLHPLVFRWRSEYDNPGIKLGSPEIKKLFYSEPKTVKDEADFIKDNLTCGQTVISIMDALSADRFVVVFDNMDLVPVGGQPALYSLAIDMYDGGMGRFGVIVATRTKNLLRFQEAGSDGDVLEIVSLSTEKSTRTSAVHLPHPTSQFTQDMLDRRCVVLERLATANLPREASESSLLLFSTLRGLTTKEFIQSRMYNLANHSYRTMLKLYSGFLSYLYHLVEAKFIPLHSGDLHLNQPTLVSYLYCWINSGGGLGTEIFLDAMSRYSEFAKGAILDPLECQLDLYLLAWLANKRSHHAILRIGSAIKSFKPLGLNSDLVVNEIYALYDKDFSFRYIDLGDSEKKYSLKEAHSLDMRIMILPLGLEFITHTITKFEFMHQCLISDQKLKTGKHNLPAEINDDIDAKVNRVLNFLGEVKHVHVATMLKLREILSGEDSDWEDYFRSNFCINSRLLIERIVESHIAHLHAISSGDRFKTWRSMYEDLLFDFYKSSRVRRH